MKYSSFLLMLFVMAGCQCSGQDKRDLKQRGNAREVRQDRMDTHSEYVDKERASIEQYLRDRGLSMDRTGSGMFFKLERDSSDLSSIEENDRVEFAYDIYLLNGRLIYSSQATGNRNLTVGREDAVVGLHEALMMMSPGDKGQFVLPSHLAYGVSGDQDKVPPLTALHYDLEIIDVQKSNRDR